MKVHLDIDTKTFIRFWLVVAGLALTAYIISAAQTALIIIGSAFFLALGLNVPVSKIARKLPSGSRVLSTALAYIVVVVFLATVVFFVIPPIAEQTTKFLQTIPGLTNSFTGRYSGLAETIRQYNLQPHIDNVLAAIQSSAAGWAGNIGQNVVSGIGSVLSFVTAALLVLVLAFLMLIEAPVWKKRFLSLYTNEKRMKKHSQVLNKMYSVVTGYITGQLTVSAIGAFFSGLTVFVLSLVFHEIPSSLAIPTAVIHFILSLIPMFGATIAGVLISLLLLFNNVPGAIIYAIYFFIYQQIENNLIAPHIQSKKLNLSALAVLISVTIGIYMFGLIGGIIAIPIAGCVRVLVDEYAVEALQARKAANAEVATAKTNNSRKTK